jgi:ParB family chromosome partitioning protein
MAKKQALGRGLGAILPPTAESGLETKADEATIYQFDEQARGRRVAEIELDQIRPNPYQPRENFDEQTLSELAASISEHGLIQPITVRIVGPRRYEIISGERRYRASRLAGLQAIAAYIREADDEDLLEWSLVENIQRQDLDPIEEAQGYQRLMEECDLTQAQVAVRVGKDRSTVANALRLLRLPPTVQKALRDGQISAGHGRVIVSLGDPDQQVARADQIIAKGMSVRSAEEYVREATAPRKPKSRSVQARPALTDAEQAQLTHMTNLLRERFGTHIAIRHETGKGGRIELQYYSEEDLERLMDILLGRS